MNEASDASQNSNPSNQAHATEDRGVSRNAAIRKACNECRQQKLRCNGVRDPFTPCARCTRLQIDCRFDVNFKRVEKRKERHQKDQQNPVAKAPTSITTNDKPSSSSVYPAADQGNGRSIESDLEFGSAAPEGQYSETQNFSWVPLFPRYCRSAILSGAFYLFSCWYTRKELGLRTAVLYSGLVLATCFSGLLAASIFSGLHMAPRMAGWQWLFIITGALGFFFGIIAVFILPDFPESQSGSGKWLFTEEERQMAVDRIRRDRVSVEESSHSVWHGVALAAKDYRTWIFVLMLCANHSAYGFNNFFSAIVKGFNLGSITAPMCVAVFGFVLPVSTLNRPTRYAASFFYIPGCFAANAMVYSWAATSLNQTPEKRAAAVAMVNLLSQFGNIWSPYFFRPGDAPRYLMAMLLMLAFSVLSVACCMVMKVSLKRANKKLLAEHEGTGRTPVLFQL